MTRSRPGCPTCGRRTPAVTAQPALFEPGPARPALQIRAPEDLAELVAPHLQDRDREHCLLVALDTKHRVLELRTVSIGSIDHTFMEPREIFRDALLAGAAAVAVAHNHPSGDPAPSPEDRAVTRRLVRAGLTLGVPLVDHIVVGTAGRWRSMGRMGLL